MFKSFFFVICAFGKPGLILTSIKKVFRISYNKFLSMMGFLKYAVTFRQDIPQAELDFSQNCWQKNLYSHPSCPYGKFS